MPALREHVPVEHYGRIAGSFAAVVLFFSSLYQLNETEQAILTQFGKPVGGLVTSPGLHLKMPFIQTVHRFDKRLHVIRRSVLGDAVAQVEHVPRPPAHGVEHLGLAGAPVPAPWPILARLPRGPELSKDAASIVRDSVSGPS